VCCRNEKDRPAGVRIFASAGYLGGIAHWGGSSGQGAACSWRRFSNRPDRCLSESWAECRSSARQPACDDYAAAVGSLWGSPNNSNKWRPWTDAISGRGRPLGAETIRPSAMDLSPNALTSLRSTRVNLGNISRSGVNRSFQRWSVFDELHPASR